jgi:hypothetical protein
MKELAPFFVQGVLMGIDEFYCHLRRPLRRWERLGHPLDTLSFIFCLTYAYLMPPTPTHLGVFAFLSLVSCLFVSKDEWEHRQLCSGFENWLHALLFMLHPVLLIWTGYLWWTHVPAFATVSLFALALSVAFFLYQLLFWNVWLRD